VVAPRRIGHAAALQMYSNPCTADPARNEVQTAPKCILYKQFNARLWLLPENLENDLFELAPRAAQFK